MNKVLEGWVSRQRCFADEFAFVVVEQQTDFFAFVTYCVDVLSYLCLRAADGQVVHVSQIELAGQNLQYFVNGAAEQRCPQRVSLLRALARVDDLTVVDELGRLTV